MNDPGRRDPRALAAEAVPLLAKHAADADAAAAFPLRSVQALRDNGLLGLLVPEQYGGFGSDVECLVEIAGVLASGCLSTAVIWSMHCQQVDAIVRHASPRLAEAVLPRVARGELYLGSVTTEPRGGGTLFSSQSPVRADEASVRIERAAPIVTGGRHADGFLVSMRAAEAPAEHAGSLFYVDRSQFAVDVTGEWDAMGMRGTESLGLSLEGTIPPWQIVGDDGEFRTIALETMAPVGHLISAACWLGAAKAALAGFVELVRSPARPGSFDVDSSLVRERLARIRMDLELVSACLSRVVEEVRDHRDRGESLAAPAVQIHLNTLKVAGSELTYRAVDRLVQLAGLSLGYRKGSPLPLERTLRDLRSGSLNYANDRLLTATGALSLLDRAVRLL